MPNNAPTNSAIDFAIRAKSYEKASSWVRSEKMNAIPKGYFKSKESLGDVLDAGGGTGFLSSYVLNGSHYESLTIVDGSKEMLSIAQDRNPNAIITCNSIENFASSSTKKYKTIFCRQVLHYVDDVEIAIRALESLLETDGLLYIGQFVFPDAECQKWHRNLTSRISENRKRTFERDSFIKLFSDAGFEIINSDFTPYEENLKSFHKRRVGNLNYDELLQSATETLTTNIRDSLKIIEQDNNIYYNISFCHLLLKKKK